MAQGKARRRSRPDSADDLPERILETTLGLAEEVGWEKVRLRHVAERLGCSLADISDHYRDLDQVANAWFRRAWRAMLAPPPRGFASLNAEERVFIVMMRWFDAVAEHRRVTSDMLSGKIYASHPHHWVPLIFDLSRTIHWLRDAAMLDAVGRRRQIEEVGLTGLFLLTLAVWSRDDSEGQSRTRNFLRNRLAACDRLMARLG